MSGIEQQVLVVTPTSVNLDSLTLNADVTFSNPSNEAVNVSLGSDVRGVSYSVSEDKQKVTFTLNDTRKGHGGTATIAIAGKLATVTLEVSQDAGGDAGL